MHDQSISSHFGCGITVPGRGFLLSNGLTSFDLEQGKPNSVAPGKLSLSSMTPTILVSPEGEPVLISGSPGGERIIACMAQTIINIVDFGMNAQDSADAPRVFAGADCVIQVEGRMPQDVIDELEAMGHTVKVGSDWDANMGSSNTITYNPDTGELHVAGDRDGIRRASHIDLYQMYGSLCMEPARAFCLGRFLQFQCQDISERRI